MPYYNLNHQLLQRVAVFFFLSPLAFETGSRVCDPGWLGTLKDPPTSSPSVVTKGMCHCILLGIILHSYIQLEGIVC